ncbi:MAG: uncharacterized metal-binding protein YceD (DUF177 family) [Glaciecola sp.]|jgi:uncharacterized metal-binding protein YceD (DUF177 family)
MYNDFIIRLEGLEIGAHDFKFLLDNSFFESLNYSLIAGGQVDVALSIIKKESFYELVFKYSGYVDNVCDRCGDDFKFDVQFELDTILKHGEEELQDDGMWVVDNNCVELDLRHYLYESLCICLPSKIAHADKKDCNQDLLKKLKEYSGETESDVDPRWDALKKLNKN